MSYYGYASYGYYSGGYGAYSTLPFTYYNAYKGLDGPGSSASYHYQEHSLSINTYAYEGYNGSLYLRNTYRDGTSYRVETQYSYSSPYETISRSSDFRTGGGIYTGIRYGSEYVGSYFETYGPREFNADASYSYSVSEITRSGAYSETYILNGQYATRDDGSYATHTSTSSYDFYDGQGIPDSREFASATTAYDASSGYFYTNASP